jgi:hypothetical protein
MSTPTALFSALSLPDDNNSDQGTEDMRGFHDTSLDERKWVARDIILSFHLRQLPLEFDADVRAPQMITEENAGRAPTEWTIPGNLNATLFTRACYDPVSWEALNKCETSKKRAILFGQKLERRFDEQLKRYDELSQIQIPELDELQDPKQLDKEFGSVCTEIWKLVDAAEDDIQRRPGLHSDATRRLLSVLESVCDRHETLPDTEISLFNGLIMGRTQGPHFMLSALQLLQVKAPHSMKTRESRETLRNIFTALDDNGASEAYLHDFRVLLE